MTWQGTIRTAINKDDLAQSGKEVYMSKRTPLGRVGEADDIAGPTIFLASDLAKFGKLSLSSPALCSRVTRLSKRRFVASRWRLVRQSTMSKLLYYKSTSAKATPPISTG